MSLVKNVRKSRPPELSLIRYFELCNKLHMAVFPMQIHTSHRRPFSYLGRIRRDSGRNRTKLGLNEGVVPRATLRNLASSIFWSIRMLVAPKDAGWNFAPSSKSWFRALFPRAVDECPEKHPKQTGFPKRCMQKIRIPGLKKDRSWISFSNFLSRRDILFSSPPLVPGYTIWRH